MPSVVFSGGPHNGRFIELPNLPRHYFVPIFSNLSWTDTAADIYPGKLEPLTKGKYSRTSQLDKNGYIIYEWEGID